MPTATGSLLSKFLKFGAAACKSVSAWLRSCMGLARIMSIMASSREVTPSPAESLLLCGLSAWSYPWWSSFSRSNLAFKDEFLVALAYLITIFFARSSLLAAESVNFFSSVFKKLFASSTAAILTIIDFFDYVSDESGEGLWRLVGGS